MEQLISGVALRPQVRFDDERGSLFKVMKNDDPFFEKFGEVYISVTKPGVIKAWKYQEKKSQNFLVPEGKVEVILFDDREGSETRKMVNRFILSSDEYQMLSFPHQIWYGFRTVSKSPSMIVNFATEPHRDEDAKTLSIEEAHFIPFKFKEVF